MRELDQRSPSVARIFLPTGTGERESQVTLRADGSARVFIDDALFTGTVAFGADGASHVMGDSYFHDGRSWSAKIAGQVAAKARELLAQAPGEVKRIADEYQSARQGEEGKAGRAMKEEQPKVTEEDVRKIGEWSQGQGAHVEAAVRLLVEEDHWIWDRAFGERCVKRSGEDVIVDFNAVSSLWLSGSAGSEGQLAMLLVIADLGSGRWQFGTLDARNRDRVAEAVATAAGNSR